MESIALWCMHVPVLKPLFIRWAYLYLVRELNVDMASVVMRENLISTLVRKLDEENDLFRYGLRRLWRRMHADGVLSDGDLELIENQGSLQERVQAFLEWANGNRKHVAHPSPYEPAWRALLKEVKKQVFHAKLFIALTS